MAVTFDKGISPDGKYYNKNSQEHDAYHMSSNKNLYEIQRDNNFEFVIPFNVLNSTLTRLGANAKALSATDAQEYIRLSVTKAFVPHFSQGVIKVRRGNTEIKYAGIPTFDAGSLEINQYVGVNTKSILEAWQSLSFNVETEKVGLAANYKIDCTLLEYAPDGQVVGAYTLYGCWISSITEGDYSSESNNKKTVSCKIEYDKAIPDYSLVK